MLDKLRLTAKNSLIYSLGNISIRLTGLILIPIYTNPEYLSVADFGILGILEITSLILISLIDLSLNFSLSRWYWDSEYINRQKSMFFTVFVSSLVMAAISIIGLSMISDNISGLLFSNEKFGELIRLMIIASAMEVISGELLALLKLQQKAVLFTISNLIKLVVNLTATVVFITSLDKGLNGIYFGQILGNAVFLLFLTRYVVKNIKIKFEGKILLEMLKFSYPLLLASIAGNLINTFDRYSLNYLGTLDNLGIYNLGFKLSNTIKLLFITSIQMAVLPLLYKIMNDTGSGRFYSKYMTYFSLLTMFFIVAVNTFSLEIISVFTVDPLYAASYTIVPLLTFAVYFGMLKDTSMIGLQISKKTKIISVVIFIVSALSLGLNVLLIPYLGIYGAGLSALLTQLVFFITIYLNAQKKYYIPYEIKKVMIIFIVGVIFSSGCFVFNTFDTGFRILFKTLLVVSFPLVFFMWRFFEPIEIVRMKEFLAKWRKFGNLSSNLEGFLKSK